MKMELRKEFEAWLLTDYKNDLYGAFEAGWYRRASPASAPEGFNHSIGAERFTTVHGAYWWHVRAGDGTQNIGKFHTKLAAEDMALTLLTAFRDGAFMQYGAMLAAAPTPPVQDDGKDAERYRWMCDSRNETRDIAEFFF